MEQLPKEEIPRDVIRKALYEFLAENLAIQGTLENVEQDDFKNYVCLKIAKDFIMMEKREVFEMEDVRKWFEPIGVRHLAVKHP